MNGFHASESQREFVESDVSRSLLVGPGGCGKTEAIKWKAWRVASAIKGRVLVVGHYGQRWRYMPTHPACIADQMHAQGLGWTAVPFPNEEDYLRPVNFHPCPGGVPFHLRFFIFDGAIDLLPVLLLGHDFDAIIVDCADSVPERATVSIITRFSGSQLHAACVDPDCGFARSFEANSVAVHRFDCYPPFRPGIDE